jgi:hypothetical protein
LSEIIWAGFSLTLICTILVNSVTKEVSGAGNIILGPAEAKLLGFARHFSIKEVLGENFAGARSEAGRWSQLSVPKIIFPAPDESITKLVSNITFNLLLIVDNSRALKSLSKNS